MAIHAYFIFLCGEGPRSRCYGRTAALTRLVQPCDEDDYFTFFHVMERRWNEIDRWKPKYSGQNQAQCHFVHHKSYMDRPGVEPRLPRWEAGDEPPDPWHGVCFIFVRRLFHAVWVHSDYVVAFYIVAGTENAGALWPGCSVGILISAPVASHINFPGHSPSHV
jgi:hypothetical protein